VTETPIASPRGAKAEFFQIVNSCRKIARSWKTYDGALRERSQKSEKRYLDKHHKLNPSSPVQGIWYLEISEYALYFGTKILLT